MCKKSSYLEEANHGLDTTDETKVDTILEWGHRNKEDSEETLPIGRVAELLFVRHSVHCLYGCLV